MITEKIKDIQKDATVLLKLQDKKKRLQGEDVARTMMNGVFIGFRDVSDILSELNAYTTDPEEQKKIEEMSKCFLEKHREEQRMIGNKEQSLEKINQEIEVIVSDINHTVSGFSKEQKDKLSYYSLLYKQFSKLSMKEDEFMHMLYDLGVLYKSDNKRVMFLTLDKDGNEVLERVLSAVKEKSVEDYEVIKGCAQKNLIDFYSSKALSLLSLI